MVMLHGGDLGLSLPPRVAPTQVVIVPIHSKDNTEVPQSAKKIYELLDKNGIRVNLDDRSIQPGNSLYQTHLIR